MTKRPTLPASTRTASAKIIRRSQTLPAVLYGHGIENRLIQIDSLAFQRVFQAAGQTSLIELTIDNQLHTVLIRDVQHHPVKDTPLHVDFYQVRLDEAIQARVPLLFTGESKAIKDLGGVLIRNIDEVEVEALAQDLPHVIEVDISKLREFNQAIHVADLALPHGVKVLHESAEVVALVQAPRTEEELAELTEEVKEEVTAVEGIKEETPAAAEEIETEKKGEAK